jgi:putative CocE/NonD family hydrolase
MSLASRIVARLARLPPARSRDVAVERDLAATMPDGAVLLADRYFPRGDEKPPIVLVRTPYGRRSFGVFGRIFAERGYQAVVQSLRGTFGSGGSFEFRDEREDGLATLDWLARQSWFGGRVGMYGPSYLGFVQWAVAAGAPEFLRALVIPIATSSRRHSLYSGDAFHLDFALTLAHTMAGQEGPAWRTLWKRLRERRELAPAFAHLPLCEADEVALGRRISFYQDWLSHPASDDPYWQAMDHSRDINSLSAEVALVAGWYDPYLSRQLEDFGALRRAGRRPRLTIGPWSHTDLRLMAAGLREAFASFDAHLRDDQSCLRPLPVRVFVLGSGRWLELPDWPPAATPTRYYLQPGAGLAPTPPQPSPADRYDFDPADPTPAVGGAVIGRHAGARDNRRLESREDVLVYTSSPLAHDLELIGPVEAELYVRSNLRHTDFFVRLCDVAPSGRSTNVCDGLLRLAPGTVVADPAGVALVRVALSPTACSFARGHRLRLQVSSAAHPRFARNLGTGEPQRTATAMKVSRQEVFHDPDRPSAVILPVHGTSADAAGRPT